MAGTPIPFPLTALPGARPGEGQGDLVNVYASKVGDEIFHRRVPGLKRFTTVTPSSRIARGQLAVDSYLLQAWTGVVEATTALGVRTALTGSLPGSSPITWARNLRPAGTQVVAVTELGTYLIDPAGLTVSTYPTAAVLADHPNSAANLGAVNSVDFYNGYFIFTRANGVIVASGLQNAGIPDSSYSLAQRSADGAFRALNNGDTVLICGEKTIEVWGDQGTIPFPLARVTVIDTGILAQWCIAGGAGQWERGVFFIAPDYTVRRLQGYEPVIVSNDAVSRDIYSVRDDVDSILTSVHVSNQQSFFTIVHPSFCWELNVGTGAWHRRQSYGSTTWRARFPANFDNRWYAQDQTGDGLVEVTSDAQNEVGDPLAARAESAPLKDFPVSIRVSQVDLDFSVGLGNQLGVDPYETDPVVLVSWSFDGGATYSNPLVRSLGRQGEYKKLVKLHNLGRSSHHGLRLKWEVTDPVPVTFKGAVVPTLNPSRARQVGVV